MKSIFRITLLLLLFSFTVKGQHVFKQHYVAGKQYTTQTTTDADMLMNFEADSATLQAMRSSGLELPMKVKSSQTMKIVTTISAKDANGKLPASFEYVDATMTQTVAGKEMTNPNPLKGAKIFGLINEKGEVAVDSIQGNASKELKEMASKMLEQFEGKVNFPARPLKIGDEFTDERPLEMPMAGGNVMKMVIKTKYKLLKVEGNEATFNQVHDLTLAMQMDKGDANATGSGKGIMKFNIKEHFASFSSTDMDMDLKMNFQNMFMTIKGKTTAESVVTIK
jgi:hypothetical protein